MLQIDKNIPIPDDGRLSNKGESKYPWHDMSVGDSFFIECLDAARRNVQTSLICGGKAVNKNHKWGRNYTTQIGRASCRERV